MLASVPEAHLEPPDRDRFCANDATLVLDGHLRRLARGDACGRLVLGQLAAAFLRRRGQQQLGFARIDDYARERLGLSGRELQSLATVARRTTELPEIARAFGRGDISWAQLRLLVGVVRSDTQQRWLSVARGRTVRALEAVIRAANGPPDTEGDSEKRVRFRLPSPRRVRRLWHHAVELARRTAGASLNHGAAAELIAAEGLSARTPPAERWIPEPAPNVADADPDERPDAFTAELDWAVVDDGPIDPACLLHGCDTADAFILDARMRAAVAALHQTAWQTGRLLRLFLDRRLFFALGFRCGSRYLRERLGLSERKARALVAIERRTWSAPAFGEAYRTGRLSWVRALTVLPVVTEDTAADWADRAQSVSVRRLADEVEWALAGRAPSHPVIPPPLGARLDPTRQRQTCARSEWEPTDADVAFRAPADVVALFRSAIIAYAAPADPLWRGLELLLEHAIAEWESQPHHRDPVFARDGWRCTVPACSSRRNLHDHHVLFRSRGGGNARANRITVCAAHHLHGIHTNVIRAWGQAPDGITWELGVRQGQRPLLRFSSGEVYQNTDVQ